MLDMGGYLGAFKGLLTWRLTNSSWSWALAHRQVGLRL